MMPDEIEKRSEELGQRIEAVKRERATPTPEEIRAREAEKHATEEGTGLNSGKA
jgi:hypothetical protein